MQKVSVLVEMLVVSRTKRERMAKEVAKVKMAKVVVVVAKATTTRKERTKVKGAR